MAYTQCYDGEKFRRGRTPAKGPRRQQNDNRNSTTYTSLQQGPESSKERPTHAHIGLSFARKQIGRCATRSSGSTGCRVSLLRAVFFSADSTRGVSTTHGVSSKPQNAPQLQFPYTMGSRLAPSSARPSHVFRVYGITKPSYSPPPPRNNSSGGSQTPSPPTTRRSSESKPPLCTDSEGGMYNRRERDRPRKRRARHTLPSHS